MDFASFIAPFPEEEFVRSVYGARPLHIPAEGESGRARAALLSWERLNALLAQRSHWTPANIALVMNSRPIEAAHYMDRDATVGGEMLRADAAKVHLFLAMGASLVANALEEVDAGIAGAAAMLARRFAGRAGANAYCSVKGIQAFPSHCDLHEVFAIHIHGEKLWRIYANRAAAPLAAPEGPEAQSLIDRAKGPLLAEYRMRPGDLLYIPRGYYHDALAGSELSLHLTFSVTPLSGIALFGMIERIAREEPLFREWLPDGMQEGALDERLAELAARIAALARSARLRDEVAARQAALATPSYVPDLPARPRLEFYARADRPAEVVRRESGAVLRHGGGEEPLGLLADAAEWAIDQRAFSVQLLAASFPGTDRARIDDLVATLLRLGIIFPYSPGV